MVQICPHVLCGSEIEKAFNGYVCLRLRERVESLSKGSNDRVMLYQEIRAQGSMNIELLTLLLFAFTC